MKIELNKTNNSAPRLPTVFSRRSLSVIAGLLLVAGCAGRKTPC